MKGCWPWSHDWTKWERKTEQWVSYGTPLWPRPEGVNFTKEYQRRECTKCGLERRRSA